MAENADDLQKRIDSLECAVTVSSQVAKKALGAGYSYRYEEALKTIVTLGDKALSEASRPLTEEERMRLYIARTSKTKLFGVVFLLLVTALAVLASAFVVLVGNFGVWGFLTIVGVLLCAGVAYSVTLTYKD